MSCIYVTPPISYYLVCKDNCIGISLVQRMVLAWLIYSLWAGTITEPGNQNETNGPY